MIRPVISFSFNWNGKLLCRSFTTIRIRNDYKYQVGRDYDIQLHKRHIGPGIIQSITHFTLDKMSPAIAFLDTGYNLEKAKQIILNMYKNSNINWATQQFSFMVIEQPEKMILPFPKELYSDYQEAPSEKVG